MSRKIALVFALGVVLGIAGIVVAQQAYPNMPGSETVLENDRVVVQALDFSPGDWTGEHSHAGNQLVVIVDDTTIQLG